MSRRLAAALAVALLVRVAAIAASDRVVADVLRYEKVSRHLLDVSWNPYETRRLFPYPPPWAAIEAAAGWTARQGWLSFPVAVKLPVLAADLAIVWLLGTMAGASPLAPWLYALHPVAVLVGGFHGQFDAIPLAFVLLSLAALSRGRRDASALSLAAAIATKSFPVLLLPFLAAAGASWRQAARYAALACLPVALLLLPFAIADAGALRRELFAYSGIADFGWAGVLRGIEWLLTGALPRSEARFWPVAAAASKALFLAAWALLLASSLRRAGGEPWRRALLVVLAFVSLYGLLSAQYLLWPVPLGLLRPGRPAGVYAAAATAGLVGFYLFLAPGVLTGALPGLEPGAAAGALWLCGSLATLATALAWLVTLWRADEGASPRGGARA